MKNVIKKSLAAVAALSMASAGMALNVSAAAGVQFNIDDQVPAKAGETVTVNVYSTDSDAQFTAFAIMLQYDERLTLKSVSSPVQAVTTSGKGNKVFATYATADPVKVSTDKKILVSYEFQVPADAKDGEEFDINWVPEGDYGFQLYDTTTDGNKLLDHTFDEKGSIKIPEVTTTTTEATTTEATTTTTAGTTAGTTAAGTTAATTAGTTKATTKTTGKTTTKSTTKVTSAPVTGNDSKGIAALAATMVAAAGAAIVIKKKKD